MWITNIAGKDIQTVSNVFGNVVKPPPRVKRIVKHESANIVTAPHERFGKMRAYKTISSCDENAV